MESLSEINKEYKTFGFWIGFLLVENNIAGLPSVGSFYYLIMLAALVWVCSRSKTIPISNAMLLVYFSCTFSILANDIPSFFQPWPRLLTFVVVTSLVSPFILSDNSTVFKCLVLKTIFYLLRFVIVASFIGAFIGIGYKYKYFQGITNHSMMMGPFAALSCLFSIYQLYNEELTKRRKYVNYLFIIMSLFCVFQSGSRAAFAGCIVSVIAMIWFYMHDRLGRVLKIFFSISVVAFLSFPIWGKYLDKIQEKNRGTTSSLDTSSREIHWKQRIAEWKSSPLIGIGFASVDTRGKASKGSTFGDDGKVETGSSWLCILSMTGLFGFLSIITIWIASIVKLFQLWRYTPFLASLLLGILVFFALHMMAEGYILAGGNTLAFIVWLTLGIVYGLSYNIDLAHEFEEKLFV